MNALCIDASSSFIYGMLFLRAHDPFFLGRVPFVTHYASPHLSMWDATVTCACDAFSVLRAC